MLPQPLGYQLLYNKFMNLKTRQLSKSEAIQAMTEDIPVKTNRFANGHHIPFSSQMENRTQSILAVKVHGYWWNLEAITLA